MKLKASLAEGENPWKKDFWWCNISVSCIRIGSESSLLEERRTFQIYEMPWGRLGCCMVVVSRVPSTSYEVCVSGSGLDVEVGARILYRPFYHFWPAGSFWAILEEDVKGGSSALELGANVWGSFVPLLICSYKILLGFGPYFVNNIHMYLYYYHLHGRTFRFSVTLFSTLVSNRIRVEESQGLLSSSAVCVVCLLQRAVNNICLKCK